MTNLEMIGAMNLPNVGGWAGALITKKNMENWYERLRKPDWRPANWVFGPVWTILYTSMGYSSYLVWRDGGGFQGSARIPLMLYGTQLTLNWAWTPIFFGMHRMGTALIDMGLLYGTVCATAVEFEKINPTAGRIMVPYLAWLTFAAALNYVVWRDNKDDGDFLL